MIKFGLNFVIYREQRLCLSCCKYQHDLKVEAEVTKKTKSDLYYLKIAHYKIIEIHSTQRIHGQFSYTANRTQPFRSTVPNVSHEEQ